MPKAKVKSAYVCQECGFESPKWLGKCTECGNWNSMIEEIVTKSSNNNGIGAISTAEVKLLRDIVANDQSRWSSGIKELDRVLGGGLVKGSLVLVGGDPGIGKSTLLLQSAKFLSEQGSVLYVSGEESGEQIRMRANRLNALGDKLYLYCETDIDNIIQTACRLSPMVIVVDSIQTTFSSELTSMPGSVTQVRESCMKLIKYAKTTGAAVFVVGHVTKEGTIAGPKVLEHMVDCVLYFEGERHESYRVLRAVKNRFGSTNEIGVFEMKNEGLIEVENPSMMLLSGRPIDAPGSAVLCCMEGTRPILAEIQALISPAGYGNARRMTTGVDYNRVVMLLAVVEKRLGMQLQNHDAYINVAGGLKIVETAGDLAIVLAIISSYKNVPLPQDLAAIGEVGLTGEIRTVANVEKRIMELKKMGFYKCILPVDNAKLVKSDEISIYPAANLMDIMRILDQFKQY